MIERTEILKALETSTMIDVNMLDIRTITMGISLLDCIDADFRHSCNKIYDKITTLAAELVKIGEDIAVEYGIPIINKRISVTPISIVGEASCKSPSDYLEFAKTLDKAATTTGIDFIGGYTALVHKGMTNGEKIFIKSIPEALNNTKRVCSSVNIATTRAGINMDAVREMGVIIKEMAELSGGLACSKFVVFANAVEDNPFMAGAFHGIGENESIIHVGISGPGVVKNALEKVRGADFGEVSESIKQAAFKITRAGQLVAIEASKRLGVKSGVIDLSLAPTPAVGDSVAEVLEELGLERCGTHGSTAALALLNDAVKKGGAMAAAHVGGLSGAFIPVSEDAGMIKAVQCGALDINKLEAMTCVCSVGLDMIGVPGNTSAETISAIIADEAAIGVINNKTTAVRILPVPNKDVGDVLEIGGLLGSAPIMRVNPFSSSDFINRGGQIPAPIHALRN